VRALLLFGVAACWTDKHPQAVVENHAASDPTGAYWCTIVDNYKYPRFPCVIRRNGGVLELIKLGGSQRFFGRITPVGDALDFDGQMFCPWGDCWEHVRAKLRPSNGGLRGTFRDVDSDRQFVVLLQPAPDSAFGGIGYGGDGYGPSGYGDFGNDDLTPDKDNGNHPPRNRRP
jgi:hypothetical protein